MARKLILCSDGTGNSGGKARGTNVWRFYKSLDNDPRYQQISFYQDGVGAQDFKLLRIIGGAFGYGLSANIREMYTFLVDNYQPGDQIYLLGFSRGAFTVRALATMLTVCGIVRPCYDDPDETQRRISCEMKRYHKWRGDAGSHPREKADISVKQQMDAKAEKKIDLQSFARYLRNLSSATRGESYKGKETKAETTEKEVEVIIKTGNYIPTINFIGVWDTVDAVGLPIDELTDALDWMFHFRFHHFDCKPIARHNYQAMSVDDKRLTFHPLLWDQGDKVVNQNIEQVWFAGMHSNVGGGYRKDEMAYVALDWMMQKAEGLGPDDALKFLPDHRLDAAKQANPYGKIYNSRSGPGAYYRYKPRNIEEICNSSHCPVIIHDSVFKRIKHNTEGYAPVNIPIQYTSESGEKPAIDIHPGNRKEPQVLADQDVWWRRIVYFLLLVTTLLLVFSAHRYSKMPLPPGDGFITGAMDRVLTAVGEFLPDYLNGGVQAFVGRSHIILVFVVFFAAIFTFRAFLKRRIAYLGKMAWNLSSGRTTHKPLQIRLEAIASKIKSLYFSQKIRDLGRKKLFPIGVLVILLILIGTWTFNIFKLPKNLPECSNQHVEVTTLGEQEKQRVLKDFHTCNPWYATGIQLEKGKRYSITVDKKSDWKDDNIEANADGLVGNPALLQRLTPFLKRKKGANWFTLIANIGGQEQKVIGSKKQFTAKHSGPLFLYVNDAICDFCLIKGVFGYYRNNHGTADITVKSYSETQKTTKAKQTVTN